MKEWIDFYVNVDKKTDGGLSTTLFVFIIPTLVSIMLLVFDVVMVRIFMDNIESVSTFGWIGWSINIVLNYIGLMLGLFIAVLVIGAVVAVLKSIWGGILKIYYSIKRFINIVQTAKQESFDTSNVEMKPKKKKMTIKA